MTPSQRKDDRMDRERFTAELQRLVDRAHDDGVALVGGYNVRSPHPDVPDYTVEITEQEKLISDGGTETTPADAAPPGGGTTAAEYQRDAVDRFLLDSM